MASVTPPDPLPPNETVGPLLLIITCTLTSLAITTTALRLWVRCARRRLGWDDYTIAATTLLATCRMSIQIVQVHHGNGRHRWYIASDEYMYNNMLGWYAQIILFATICLVKISICLLILRIKNTATLRRLLYGVMIGLVVTNFGCIIILLAECSPVEAYWEGQGDKCWNPKVRIYSIYFTIAYSIVTDLLCSLLPLVVVWKVQIPLKTKILVCGLMSLGLLATTFATIRASSLGLKTNDLSWTYCIAAIWSNLELFIGIIAANLALARSIFVFIRDGTRSLTSQTRSSTGYCHSRSRYLENSNVSVHLSGKDAASNVISSNCRRASISKSEGSDTPFKPGIQKSMEFYVMEEAQRSNSSNLHREHGR